MTGRTNDLPKHLTARLSAIRATTGVSAKFIFQQSVEEWLDKYHPECDSYGCMPADRESIRQASADFETLGRWTPSGGAIHAKSFDRQGRATEFDGLYVDGIVTLHTVYFKDFEEKMYTLSDILTAEEFDQLNAVLTDGMSTLMQLRAARN